MLATLVIEMFCLNDLGVLCLNQWLDVLYFW